MMQLMCESSLESSYNNKLRRSLQQKNCNVKVNGARDAFKESPPRRAISVAVQEKVFIVLSPFAAQTVWTITSEIVLKSMFTQVTKFNPVSTGLFYLVVALGRRGGLHF